MAASRPTARRILFVLGAALLLASCAPAASQPTPPASGAPPAAPTAAPSANQTLVLAELNPLVLGPWGTATTTGGGYSLMGIHSTGLVDLDDQGNTTPWIAASLPSLDNGSIEVLADGRMRTTWRLRPDVTWQDGAPFTADDVVFSHQVLTDLPPGGTDVNLYIDQVVAVDPHTVDMFWKTTYYNALFLDFRNFWLLPQHLLAQPYAQSAGDKLLFLDDPYFSTAYVNLGPFRLTDFGSGQQGTFERYEGYFLGAPKLARVIINVIPDENAIAAGFRAGTIDAIAERAATASLSLTLRDELQSNGQGSTYYRQANWKGLWFQGDTQWARPPEIARDPRLRAALYEAIDREGLRQFTYPGVPNTNADSFIAAGDPRGATVGQPFARYTYNPDQSIRDLLAAGWTRTPDGHFLDRAGEPVQLEVRSSPVDAPQIAVVADYWRKVGIDAQEFIVPPQFQGPTPLASQFPGVQLQARGVAEGVFPVFDGRLISTAANNWTGVNTNNYENPELDRLIDQLYSTPDFNARAPILKQMGDVMASDLPTLPVYWQISILLLSNNVRGPFAHDFQTSDAIGYDGVRNAHLWTHG